MNQKLENLLASLKTDPHLGKADEAFVLSLREKIVALQPQQVEAPSPAWVDVLLRVPRELTDIIARPVALAALFVVMVLGGWITGVNASLDTLPGDMLYPIKLVSERAQLSLASVNTKTQLRAEFATRRLTEVATLVQSDVPEKKERLQRALDGFQKQMDGVSADLEHQETEEASVELARIIEQKSDELEMVLELTETVKDETSRDAVSTQVGATQETKQQAVQTLVDNAPDSPVSRQELERQFTNDLRDLFARTRTTELRIGRIESVLAQRADATVTFDARAFKGRLKGIDVSAAENFAAAGIYARAFELLGQEKAVLRALNDELLAVEVALTQPVEERIEELENLENGGIEELENVVGEDVGTGRDLSTPEIEDVEAGHAQPVPEGVPPEQEIEAPAETPIEKPTE